MGELIQKIKGDPVLCAALALAALSSLAVPPDAAYAGYFDWRTLALLFCLMLVMAGLREIGVFRRLGRQLLRRVHTARQVASVLVLLCFFSSMAITNDVSLITFVPFAITVLHMAGMDAYLLPVVVLQTVAANLGSMATPIGNPQNLYLFSRSGMGAGPFFALMLPYSALSLALLAGCLRLVKDEPISAIDLKVISDKPFSGRQMALYLGLFGVCVCAVANLIPWQAASVLVCAAAALTGPQLFIRVDYALLGTFCGFFVFVGNLARIEPFRAALQSVLAGNELLTAAGSSQIISNVPAALLLSGFTNRWDALIVGTNLGGLGTLIASMASLISYKYVVREHPEDRSRYLLRFTAVNAAFLAILGCAAFFLERVS